MTGAVSILAGGQRLSPRWVERFRSAVVTWFFSHGRDFPWRHTSNPFQILIAEMLLRQTQAERVATPYLELVSRYPDANAMGQADVEELRKWFKPLGLVQRADQLVATAKILVERHGGEVPDTLHVLLKLPGLGRYSARAVLCLSFGQRLPMIDESSGRVLRRVFGLTKRCPSYSDSSLLAISERILPPEAVGFNLGLLDIAAACCHPNRSDCPECPLPNMCASSRFTSRSQCASPRE